MKNRTSGVPDRAAVGVASNDGLDPNEEVDGSESRSFNAPVASLVGVPA